MKITLQGPTAGLFVPAREFLPPRLAIAGLLPGYCAEIIGLRSSKLASQRLAAFHRSCAWGTTITEAVGMLRGLEGRNSPSEIPGVRKASRSQTFKSTRATYGASSRTPSPRRVKTRLRNGLGRTRRRSAQMKQTEGRTQ
jgi:hypothetical protein